MHGDIFALAIIFMTYVTLMVLKDFGKRPGLTASLAGILLLVATFFVLSIVAFGHACSRGGPFGVVVLGAVSAGAIRATVDKKSVRRWAWIGWFVFTFWGSHLCHLDGYIGNPTYGERLAQRALEDLRCTQDVLRKACDRRGSLRLPEGWIEESWRASTGEELEVPTTCVSGIVGHYWHTWFTGVFFWKTHHCGIWCPGGTLKSCSESLEIRPGKSEM